MSLKRRNKSRPVIKNPNVPGVELWLSSGARVPGDLEVTDHHISFKGRNESVRVLHVSVQSVTRQGLQPSGTLLTIMLKNFRQLRIAFPIDSVAGGTKQLLEACKTPTGMDGLYALTHVPSLHLVDGDGTPKGWSIYGESHEMEVMVGRAPAGRWRTTRLNANYRAAPTLPRELIVPAVVEDSVMEDIFKFRQGGRVPHLAYVHAANGAVIMRCAQPLLGKEGRCYEDERLFRGVLEATGSDKGVIVDTRSQSDADRHKAKGGGSEGDKTYYNWTRVFADIPTGTDQQNAFAKFCDALQDTTLATSSFLSKMEGSGWLRVVRNAFSTAVVVANVVHSSGRPVVVHGRYGTDETLAVLVLAQLLLDNRYRTLSGFQILIEKELVKGGYPFATRSAGFSPTGKIGKEDVLPTMALLIDCIWQLMQQFPYAFEFNERMLLTLFDHAMGSEYGTFLLNCERERDAAGLADKAPSLWDFMAQPAERSRLLNAVYDASAEESSTYLKACFRPQCIGIWRAFYCRYSHNNEPQDEVAQLVMFRHDMHTALREEADIQRKRIKELEARLAELGGHPGGDPSHSERGGSSSSISNGISNGSSSSSSSGGGGGGGGYDGGDDGKAEVIPNGGGKAAAADVDPAAAVKTADARPSLAAAAVAAKAPIAVMVDATKNDGELEKVDDGQDSKAPGALAEAAS